jgi:hypothetical protein
MKSPEQIGTEILARLARQAERNKGAGKALRAEIRAIMGASADTERLTAKIVRNRLSRLSPPSIRTTQQHMRAIRAESVVRSVESSIASTAPQISLAPSGRRDSALPKAASHDRRKRVNCGQSLAGGATNEQAVERSSSDQ